MLKKEGTWLPRVEAARVPPHARQQITSTVKTRRCSRCSRATASRRYGHPRHPLMLAYATPLEPFLYD